MMCLIALGGYILRTVVTLLVVGAILEAIEDSRWWRARRWS